MTNAFWDFSLKVYATPGVPDACLKLQDRFGIDVNLLLFAAYEGARQIVLSEHDVTEVSRVVHDWHEHVVKPLRNVRRTTKQMIESGGLSAQQQAQSLRNKIKASELESEKVEQTLIDDWARRHPLTKTAADREAAIRSNVGRLFTSIGAPDGETICPDVLLDASLAQETPHE